MTPILIIAGILVGLVVVDLTEITWLIGETRWLAMVAGAVIGALWARLIVLQRRVDRLEQATPGTNESPAKSREPADPPKSSRPGPSRQPATKTTASPQTRIATGKRPERPPAPTHSRKRSTGDRTAWLRRWFMQGNVPVKIGVLVLFVGVAALLRYATEQGWLALPIEARLLGVATAAIAGLIFAWRQREQRRVFALSLQGGAIGVLAMTVFAAFRLYEVLPAPAAFAMLVVLTGATGVLAVVQNALALGVLAVIAGFAAPVLVTTGEGNHVALFGWYTLLNLSIFGVAWHRAWPLLNRIGFAFTFIIGTVWGVLNYAPTDYATTQPFLLLFFVLYLLIPILNETQARRTGQRGLDAILVFGLPLFAFPLQAALLEGERLAIALSALVMSLIYVATATLLLRRWQIRVLGRSHAVLAVGFATLAVPFAFSGPTIAIIWALEGAGLVWFGLYQDHRLSRLTGLALQALAGLVWFAAMSPAGEPGLAIVNPFYLSGLALVVSLAISAWRYADAGASARLVNPLALIAILAWTLSGMVEIDQHVKSTLRPDLLLLLAAMTAILTAMAHRYRDWFVTGLAPAVALASGIVIAFMQTGAHDWPLGGWGAMAWLLFGISAWNAQSHLQGADVRWRALSALATHASAVVMAAIALVHVAEAILELSEGWQWLAGALPLLGVCAWLRTGRPAPLSPGQLPQRQYDWLSHAAFISLVFGLLASLGSAGTAAPLPYLPVINPLETGQLVAVLLMTHLALDPHRADKRLLPWVAALAFLVITVMLLRGVHHLAGIDWSAAALFDSRIGQATMSIGWTVIAVVAWIAGSGRGNRMLWLAGAILLGIVLVKLLLIDRVFLSTVAGIVSFLAFGLLSILVGYLAPAPPKSSGTRPHTEATQ